MYYSSDGIARWRPMRCSRRNCDDLLSGRLTSMRIRSLPASAQSLGLWARIAALLHLHSGFGRKIPYSQVPVLVLLLLSPGWKRTSMRDHTRCTDAVQRSKPAQIAALRPCIGSVRDCEQAHGPLLFTVIFGVCPAGCSSATRVP